MKTSAAGNVRARVAADRYCFFTGFGSNAPQLHQFEVFAVTDPLPPLSADAGRSNAPRPADIRTAARELETTFLAEMLKSAGFGTQENSFSGGPGERQFASFQREAVAREMVEAGGIGLTAAFVEAMMEKADDR
jgi:Rod binding domain-containing protein